MEIPIEVRGLQKAKKEELRDYLLTFVTEERRNLMERLLKKRTRYVTVALEDIFQPHNASAAIRSCECFGVHDIHIIENRFEYRVNPDVLMGAGKWVNLKRYKEPGSDNTRACLENLKSEGYRLAATIPDKDAVPLWQTPLDEKIALMFGTEEEGLSAQAMEMADLRLAIPMYGFTQSFNISVSVALCLYDICTRLREEREDWSLPEEEQLEVALEWLMNSVRNAEAISRRFLGQDASRIQGPL